MPIRRDHRTGNWFFRTTVRIPRKKRFFGTPGVPGAYHDLPNTRVGAQEAERRAIMRAMTGTPFGPAVIVPTLTEYSPTFVDVYAASQKPSSRTDKRQRLNAYILPMFGHLRLDELRQSHIDELVAELLERELDRKTINNITGVLSTLLRYAAKNKLIAEPDLKFAIKVQDVQLVAVAPADVDAIAAVADLRYRVAILLAADAGLRIGEIRAQPWIDVNDIAREITIASSFDREGHLTDTKGWERRTVPMSERLWDAMREIPRVGPRVFSRLDGDAIGYDAVRDRIHEIYLAAKVTAPKKPWHALRHTFGTELANNGAPIQTIRALMGHKSIETTLRYLHTDRDQKRAAIRGIGDGNAVRRGSHVAADEKTTK